VVSRLPSATVALFRRGFPAAPAVAALTRPRTVTRRIILQKARSQACLRTSPPTAWTHTISGSISLPSPGYFSPFPHGTVRYRSLRVACLGGWSPQIRPRFFVPGCTQVPSRVNRNAAYTAITCCGGAFQTPSDAFKVVRACRQTDRDGPTTPYPQGLPLWHGYGLGKTPVRSPLLRGWFSLPRATKMFQFARFPRHKAVLPEGSGLPHSETQRS
jgi:hypothetical protein